ncbi:MAG: DUF2089 domain-containing protein [Trueperaceae bacterium]|nr:MAG: DUF2089 domain-containing protein [Trueperaceae bacterium]
MTMAPLPMPTACPVTGEPLEVTRLQAPGSGVAIEGRFRPNEFALLSPEHVEFLRLFVKVRGNLKEVERAMGVSYPTVRLRFEHLLRALGYESAEDADDARDDVLSLLERGEIDPAEAAKRLEGLRRR